MSVVQEMLRTAAFHTTWKVVGSYLLAGQQALVGQTATHQKDSGSLELPTEAGALVEKDIADAQARAAQEKSSDSPKSQMEGGMTAQDSADGRNGEAEVSQSVSTATEVGTSTVNLKLFYSHNKNLLRFRAKSFGLSWN